MTGTGGGGEYNRQKKTFGHQILEDVKDELERNALFPNFKILLDLQSLDNHLIKMLKIERKRGGGGFSDLVLILIKTYR